MMNTPRIEFTEHLKGLMKTDCEAKLKADVKDFIQYSLLAHKSLTIEKLEAYYDSFYYRVKEAVAEMNIETITRQHQNGDNFIDKLPDNTSIDVKLAADLSSLSRPTIISHGNDGHFHKEARGNVHVKSFAQWLKGYKSKKYEVFKENWLKQFAPTSASSNPSSKLRVK